MMSRLKPTTHESRSTIHAFCRQLPDALEQAHRRRSRDIERFALARHRYRDHGVRRRQQVGTQPGALIAKQECKAPRQVRVEYCP